MTAPVAAPPRPRVLLVDDDPRILAGLRRQLHREYEVVTAPGGAEGLAALRSAGPFAVVISDMRMPGMDGATFLAQVRVTAPQTTRILLTGQTELSTAIRAINDGQVFRFLDKPCAPDLLDRTLHEAVNRYRTACDEHRILASALADRRMTDSNPSPSNPMSEPQVGPHNFDYQVRYQPIVELATGRVTAVQAVLRNNPDPAESADSPPVWLPPAEPTIALRRWVLAAACQEVASWPAITATGPLRVHLRLTSGYLRDPRIADDLARTLVLSGLEPDRLVVEVADTSPLAEPGVRHSLQVVATWGVKLHLLCTSGGPPVAIADLPFSGIKVSSPALLGVSNVSADNPGLSAAVEGVRTYDEHRQAVEAGCTTAQGPRYGDDTDPSHLLTHLAEFRQH